MYPLSPSRNLSLKRGPYERFVSKRLPFFALERKHPLPHPPTLLPFVQPKRKEIDFTFILLRQKYQAGLKNMNKNSSPPRG
jgi:hypothetical protein